jgi:hypothetical protein
MAGHSRPKDGVASARLCPAIHVLLVVTLKDVDARQRRQVYVVCAKQTTLAGHDGGGSHLSISAICSAASAGVIRPSATSVSVFFTLARIAGSARSRAIIRCSSIDHIHFTC